MRILFFVIALFLLVPDVEARPVSYRGGWTVMQTNNIDSNAVHLHYSPTQNYSVGLRHEYFRDVKSHSNFLQLNILAKRWNKKNSQANIYIKSGVGAGYDDGIEPGGFAGIAADWEDRRYFISYENRALYIDDIDQFFEQKARIGIAPYIGDYGDVHTWLMLETRYDAGKDDDFSLTPLIRVFQGPTLVEAGYNLDNGILFNFIQRF